MSEPMTWPGCNTELVSKPQPIEHYTLKEVEQMDINDRDWKRYHSHAFTLQEIHALINACINERIGEPIAVVLEDNGLKYIERLSVNSLAETSLGSRLYTLKEPKP